MGASLRDRAGALRAEPLWVSGKAAHPLRGHKTYLDVGNPIEWREHKPPRAFGHRQWLEVRR